MKRSQKENQELRKGKKKEKAMKERKGFLSYLQRRASGLPAAYRAATRRGLM